MSHTDTAKAVVDAINTHRSEDFFALFIDKNAVAMTDNGNTRNFQQWVDHEFFSDNNTLTVINMTEDGSTVHMEGEYRSAKWGLLKTFMELTFNDEGKITQMVVGER